MVYKGSAKERGLRVYTDMIKLYQKHWKVNVTIESLGYGKKLWNLPSRNTVFTKI